MSWTVRIIFFRFISIFLKDKFVQLTIEERQTFIIFKNVGVPYRETAKKVKNLNYVKKKSGSENQLKQEFRIS